MSCLMHEVWILEHNFVCMHSYVYLKCIFIQGIEQVLVHEINRFVVKSFRRLMKVKEEVTGKRKGGKHARQEKEQKLVQQGSGRVAVPSIRLQQEQGPHEEDSPYLFICSHERCI